MTAPSEQRDTRHGGAEIKFLVDGATAEAIRQWSRPLTAADAHGAGPHGDEYRTTTIYFDTGAFDVYWRRGSYGRSKLRIRRYGDADQAFVERKLRTSTLLAKRRTMVPVADLGHLENVCASDWPARWFHDRLRRRRLAAVCQVAYLRTARVLSTPHGVARLTLDTDLRALPLEQSAYRQGRGTFVARARTIVEMKYSRTIPAMFKQLVEDFRLEPARISKYRLAMETIRPGIARATNEGGDHAAALEASHV
jgi:hypothetical protein